MLNILPLTNKPYNNSKTQLGVQLLFFTLNHEGIELGGETDDLCLQLCKKDDSRVRINNQKTSEIGFD